MQSLPFQGASVAPTQGLRDRVYDLIFDMILSSSLEPGTRLSIDGIARDLNVSPTPVREAMVKLERTALVLHETNKGYRIAPRLDPSQMAQLFDARIILECGAARLAHGEAKKLRGQLTKAVHRQRIAFEGLVATGTSRPLPVHAVHSYFEADWDFHRHIIEATKNSFLIEMSTCIATHVHRIRQTVETGITDAEDALNEHERIIDALDESADSAAAAMQAHIENVAARSAHDESLVRS